MTGYLNRSHCPKFAVKIDAICFDRIFMQFFGISGKFDLIKKQYVADEIVGMIYETVIQKLKPEIDLREPNGCIPETRNSSESPKQLFRKYFYSVVKYKERKPGIYTGFDEHMKQTLGMEFYRKIMGECYHTD